MGRGGREEMILSSNIREALPSLSLWLLPSEGTAG